MKTARKITLFIALALCTVCLIAGLFALKPVFAYTDGTEITSNAGDAFRKKKKSHIFFLYVKTYDADFCSPPPES